MRSSSATAYVHPALFRPNLDVLINTTVTKLLRTDSNGYIPTFRGVQFTQSMDCTYSSVFSVLALHSLLRFSSLINPERY